LVETIPPGAVARRIHDQRLVSHEQVVIASALGAKQSSRLWIATTALRSRDDGHDRFAVSHDGHDRFAAPDDGTMAANLPFLA
jgi:hypothetical protein